MNVVDRNPAKTPIQIQISDYEVTIDCCLRFNRRAVKSGPLGRKGPSYASLIQSSVARFWSGTYDCSLAGQPGVYHVSVVFCPPGTRRACLICVRPLLFMPAHVVSPFYRRLWGIFKTGQIESLGLNWSPEHPGIMVLPPYRNRQVLGRVAAHEFGHLLGLGDAYGAFYRFYANAPGTGCYMMNSNGSVQPQEIGMVLDAHMTRRMQYFPRKFDWHAVRHGVKKDVKRLVRLFSRHCSHLARKIRSVIR